MSDIEYSVIMSDVIKSFDCSTISCADLTLARLISKLHGYHNMFEWCALMCKLICTNLHINV